MELDLDQALSGCLIENFIRQTGRYHDRDSNDAWMKYDNFGEFYEARKHMFTVTYSRVEFLLAAILKMYIVEQLSVAMKRGEPAPSGGWDRVSDAVRSALESDSKRLLGLLRHHWPDEYVDIERLNNTDAAVR